MTVRGARGGSQPARVKLVAHDFEPGRDAYTEKPGASAARGLRRAGDSGRPGAGVHPHGSRRRRHRRAPKRASSPRSTGSRGRSRPPRPAPRPPPVPPRGRPQRSHPATHPIRNALVREGNTRCDGRGRRVGSRPEPRRLQREGGSLRRHPGCGGLRRRRTASARADTTVDFERHPPRDRAHRSVRRGRRGCLRAVAGRRQRRLPPA